MLSYKAKIIDPIGIHARPASKVVSSASRFGSKVEIKFGTKVANAKSIMNLMSLGIKKDSEIEIIVDGSDEKQALDAIVQTMKEDKLI